MVNVLCLAISSPRSQVTERRSAAGSLPACVVSAATTTAVSLQGTLISVVKREWRSTNVTMGLFRELLGDRPPHDRGQRGPQLQRAIHAWVQVEPEKPTGTGKLSGIPFGVKDISKTQGLSTAYGSPVYKGRIGTDDAAIVRELRGRGAILLGKTDCTAFAYMTPPPTRNPRNLEHTPGGSSSGSAAAVAAGMWEGLWLDNLHLAYKLPAGTANKLNPGFAKNRSPVTPMVNPEAFLAQAAVYGPHSPYFTFL
jgi:Asp-tRNA(Asn)/Glu-tRNA(Gln) amidotransferase A subunit family amidase